MAGAHLCNQIENPRARKGGNFRGGLRYPLLRHQIHVTSQENHDLDIVID